MGLRADAGAAAAAGGGGGGVEGAEGVKFPSARKKTCQKPVGRSWQFNNQNRTIYGSVKSVRIYNRVLTDEEIKHNYELDKARFKIE